MSDNPTFTVEEGEYTRWCKWCAAHITTARPWQEHRDRHAGDSHAEDPEAKGERPAKPRRITRAK